MNRTSKSARSFPALTVAMAAGLALVAAAPATAQEEDTEETTEESAEPTKGEKRLARMLEGRVAGEPTSCIRNMPTDRMRTIDKTAYVFGRGNTIYVQRTTRPENIDDRDTLVTRRFGGGSQLCRQDLATTIDPVTRIFSGAVLFEDFVPYTRVEKDQDG